MTHFFILILFASHNSQNQDPFVRKQAGFNLQSGQLLDYVYLETYVSNLFLQFKS